VGIVSVLTSYLASAFLAPDEKADNDQEAGEPLTREHLEDLHRQLSAIKESMERLEKQGE
jgi:hypothetical protein